MITYNYIGNDEQIKAFNDYYKAEEQAKKEGLILAEYGDVYGSNKVYCYWNKTGNRNDAEVIICYYTFNEHGKPQAISEEELQRLLFY